MLVGALLFRWLEQVCRDDILGRSESTDPVGL